MLQILGIPGYKCNRLRLLQQNSFEDGDLPVQVKKRMCSHGFRQELHFSRAPFKTSFWTLGNSWGRTYFELSNYAFLRQYNISMEKKVTQLAMPFVFINFSTTPVVLEMHINVSCCLRCLMKLAGICNKINFKFDSYAFICVLSYLLSQKGKWIDFINF